MPSSLNTATFQTAWAEWCDHRSELARLHPQKRWTPRAARNTLAECKSHGADKAEKAIRSAIANGWQGLVWERHAEPRGSRGPQEGARPRYPAYQVATATLGLSPEDISTF
ncbi:MAG: hypothetical protein OJI67_21500 [Prosthecobacter sp.]|nr:hypothetical protein [Prosthecobacter sp.]